MKAFGNRTIVLISTIALAFIANAEEKRAAPEGAGHAAFERIKALSGEWEVAQRSGDHVGPAGAVSYKVTAGGSAVLETLFAGTEHEMVTLYYMDGDDLVLTHYCMLHNQPHMRADATSSADKITFKCVEGANPKLEAEDHMHQATFTFVDADHLKTEWVLYKGGKADSTHSFELARKKK